VIGRKNISVSSAGVGAPRGPWRLMLLLAVAVAVPTVCVLWFMNQAMRNTRLAVRQKLIEAYEPDLREAAADVAARWQARADALSSTASDAPAPERFAALAAAGVCDGAVIYDAAGEVAYPGEPPPGPVEAEPPAGWAEARRLELELATPSDAAEAYGKIAEAEEDTALRARARVAQARCLAAAGHHSQAAGILRDGIFRDETCAEARDDGGRLIAPLAGLRALELLPADSTAAGTLTRDLAARLNDYSGPAIPSSQRRFLMRRLLALTEGAAEFPSREAEELAAEYLSTRPSPPAASELRPSLLSGIWRRASTDGRVVGLFREQGFLDEMRALAREGTPRPGTNVAVRRPDDSPGDEDAFLTSPLGAMLPGWRLALILEGEDPFSAAAEREVAGYVWASLLSVGAVVLVALVAGRYLLLQTRLTRLKNDFIATVTHELKTPLASVRLFAESLREGRYEDEAQARRYLDLLVKENERLSRLIDNFLSFSRMERNKRAFNLELVPLGEVIQTAADVVAQRFEATGCRFQADAPPDLPPITADRDALVTVLLNLLDNAFKYSGEDKHIALRAFAADGNVCIEVQDNGVGMSRREARRAFDRFYQADASLSRSAGGCGLGLSIVKFIVDAHGGSVDVRSEPGKGSTFTVTLPAADPSDPEA